MTKYTNQVDEIFSYVKEKYGTTPEYLWERTPDCGVLRHSENKKWYAIVMRIPMHSLGISSEEKVNIINLKCDPVMIGFLVDKKTIFPAYHMNKKHWITIILNGSMKINEILSLIDSSWNLTK